MRRYDRKYFWAGVTCGAKEVKGVYEVFGGVRRYVGRISVQVSLSGEVEGGGERVGMCICGVIT